MDSASRSLFAEGARVKEHAGARGFFVSRYLHKRPGMVQVDEKSTDLDQTKNSSREICILGFFSAFVTASCLY